MKIHIKFFGQLAEITGKSHMETGITKDTDALKEKLTSDFPRLRNFKFFISVNKKIAKTNIKLEPGNEVAFLPPFAGG